MRGPVLAEVVLIAALGIVGWVIIGRMPPSPADSERSAHEANLRLGFRDARGIGLRGERIESGQLAQTTRVAAFLLRSSSLSDDLSFWRDVARLLPAASGVRLVGYCDGRACTDASRLRPEVAPFPIIVYGEAVDSQAVINADMLGAFVSADNGAEVGGEIISWRVAGQEPDTIATRLLR